MRREKTDNARRISLASLWPQGEGLVEEPYRKGVNAGDKGTNLGKGDSVVARRIRARDLREDTTQSAELFELTYTYLLLCATPSRQPFNTYW